MNPNQNHGADPSGPILTLLAIAATLLGGLYAGAQLAALAVHHHTLGPMPLDTVVQFASRLPKHLTEPRDAWPEGPWTTALTGPVPFWIATIVVWLIASALIIGAVRLFSDRGDVGQDRKERFGAPAWPREATRTDLAPLIVKGPTPGRTIIGRARRRLIATEDRRSLDP